MAWPILYVYSNNIPGVGNLTITTIAGDTSILFVDKEL